MITQKRLEVISHLQAQVEQYTMLADMVKNLPLKHTVKFKMRYFKDYAASRKQQRDIIGDLVGIPIRITKISVAVRVLTCEKFYPIYMTTDSDYYSKAYDPQLVSFKYILGWETFDKSDLALLAGAGYKTELYTELLKG